MKKKMVIRESTQALERIMDYKHDPNAIQQDPVEALQKLSDADVSSQDMPDSGFVSNSPKERIEEVKVTMFQLACPYGAYTVHLCADCAEERRLDLDPGEELVELSPSDECCEYCG